MPLGLFITTTANLLARKYTFSYLMLSVFVAYNGDMSPDHIMSPEIMSDIISDGMERFGKRLEKNVWKTFFEKTF